MQRFAEGSKKFARAGWVLAATGVVWASVVGFGLRKMLNYEDGPAEAGTPPAEWPAESGVPRKAGLATIVVFAHPKCPCTDATIGELAILMTRLQGKAAAIVLFVRPPGLPEGWEETSLWRKAREIPGVTVFRDPGGVEARWFGAQSSGQTILYDARGRLRFNGGITASRGHSGDNSGRTAIVSLVTQGTSETDRTSVFGCSLHDPTTRAAKGEGTWLRTLWAKIQ
jgi:hypothetical protein